MVQVQEKCGLGFGQNIESDMARLANLKVFRIFEFDFSAFREEKGWQGETFQQIKTFFLPALAKEVEIFQQCGGRDLQTIELHLMLTELHVDQKTPEQRRLFANLSFCVCIRVADQPVRVWKLWRPHELLSGLSKSTETVERPFIPTQQQQQILKVELSRQNEFLRRFARSEFVRRWGPFVGQFLGQHQAARPLKMDQAMAGAAANGGLFQKRYNGQRRGA